MFKNITVAYFFQYKTIYKQKNETLRKNSSQAPEEEDICSQ